MVDYHLKCVECGTPFIAKANRARFCSPQCKGKHPYTLKKITTESQYFLVSGNWRRYLQRLLYSGTRREDGLTLEVLLTIIEKQDYKCALTGQPLTCDLNKGMIHFTNASIDRIEPGKGYNKENIRLVCRIANVMKWNMSDEELKLWCRRILENAKG